MHASPSALRRGPRVARVLVLVAACAVLVNCGVLGGLRTNPGFASFGSPGVGDTDRELAISLGPLPLKLARFVTRDDTEMQTLLRDIKAVRVYTYGVDGDVERVHARIEDIRERLVRRGWDQVIAVRDDGERVAALVKMDKRGAIRGLAVVVQDDEEVVLVNVIGNLRPESFSAMMAELDIELPTVAVSSR
jgi:hypothetical protein